MNALDFGKHTLLICNFTSTDLRGCTLMIKHFAAVARTMTECSVRAREPLHHLGNFFDGLRMRQRSRRFRHALQARWIVEQSRNRLDQIGSFKIRLFHHDRRAGAFQGAGVFVLVIIRSAPANVTGMSSINLYTSPDCIVPDCTSPVATPASPFIPHRSYAATTIS
jgi:hypothetical protein